MKQSLQKTVTVFDNLMTNLNASKCEISKIYINCQ